MSEHLPASSTPAKSIRSDQRSPHPAPHLLEGATMERVKSASERIPRALSLPPRWLHLYGDFVVKNASSVSQIESALRSLTYIIPGRFRESEIASETLHSGIQLLSLYHDSLLARAVARLPHLPKTTPSPHNRYTRFWTQSSTLYRRLALTLQMIQYTELLWEMTAKRRGEKVRWRVVVLLEAIKALCRLLLLRLTHLRPLASPPLPERDVDPSTLEEPSTPLEEYDIPPVEAETTPEDFPVSPSPALSSSSSTSSTSNWSMPRTGLTLPTLPSSHDISSYLVSRVLTADDIKPAPALFHRLAGAGHIAEVAHIIRPLIYALALQRWASASRSTDGSGRKAKSSWWPWLLGFSIEYGARQLAKRDFAARVPGGNRARSALERDELSRRGWQLAWWGMRGAFYENFTGPALGRVTGALRGKPLLDLVGGVIEDYEFLWDRYYFSTATM